MMTQIKHALVFLWGVAYMGSWWVIKVVPATGPEMLWLLIPWLFAILTTVAITIMVANFFSAHWNEE